MVCRNLESIDNSIVFMRSHPLRPRCGFREGTQKGYATRPLGRVLRDHVVQNDCQRLGQPLFGIQSDSGYFG